MQEKEKLEQAKEKKLKRIADNGGVDPDINEDSGQSVSFFEKKEPEKNFDIID
jgi:hypothetical protein